MSLTETYSAGNKCPYWSKTHERECRMTMGGLYIPMPFHVEQFCFSSGYFQCKQYRRCGRLMRGSASVCEMAADNGRRRLQRIVNHVPVVIGCHGERDSRSILPGDELARSVDLSLGGFRIENQQKIPLDALVSFKFSLDFSSLYVRGEGKVKWSKEKKGGGRFETGVAFLDCALTQSNKMSLSH